MLQEKCVIFAPLRAIQTVKPEMQIDHYFKFSGKDVKFMHNFPNLYVAIENLITL